MAGPDNRKNPQQRLRKLVKRGEAPEQPLYVPLAYSVASRIEEEELFQFLHDATKLSKGLTALHQILQTDGILCFVSGSAEAEALGGSVDWSVYPPRVAKAADVPFPENMGEPLRAQRQIATSVDVIKRLAATIKGAPVLAVAITGPATLAEQAVGQNNSPVILEQSGRVVSEAGRIFAEAGAHLVFVAETVLPETSDEAALSRWGAALAPVCNIARFYQSLPVLLPFGVENADFGTLQAATPSGLLFCHNSDQAPLDAAQPSGVMLSPSPANWKEPGHNTSLVTTAGEIAADNDIADLREASLRLRTKLDTHENG